MNLYLISQSVNRDYDTYSDVVVRAETAEEARVMHPSGATETLHYLLYRSWAKPEHVEVEYIGHCDGDNVEKGVVCASFHAG